MSSPDGQDNLQRLANSYNARPEHNPNFVWIVRGQSLQLVPVSDLRRSARSNVQVVGASGKPTPAEEPR